MMLRTEFALAERLVLLALPASGFASRVVDSQRMQLALGAAAHLDARPPSRMETRRAILTAASRVDVDDLALEMRRRALLEVMVDVNFLLRPVTAYRAERLARAAALTEAQVALAERAPDPDVATAVLLLDATRQSHALDRSRPELAASIETWRRHDAGLMRAFEAYDALRAIYA